VVVVGGQEEEIMSEWMHTRTRTPHHTTSSATIRQPATTERQHTGCEGGEAELGVGTVGRRTLLLSSLERSRCTSRCTSRCVFWTERNGRHPTPHPRSRGRCWVHVLPVLKCV
jgi:hypothetical protein